ncbi:MAG TPA: FAD-dependent oxidoreductase [Solirubrobacteraceae bacterium]|jgi:uncharacterized protein with NAD-binding domain and iron-sulfur cluster|nr:FAD-dependent oxidoreductase [Solirubrobacteraceae bacterium]
MVAPTSAVTRRRFVRDAAIATLAAGDLLAAPAPAARRRGRPRRPTVAVLGGGIAGLTAAHELAERGFDVTVYERRAWGGKARSTSVPASGAGGRRPLPGEHGFRVFFGFYVNNPDTFRRIPFGSNADGVFGNLTAVPQLSFARDGKRQLILPADVAAPRAYTPALIHQTLLGAALQLRLPPEAAAYFADRVVVYLSSCDARRIGQWDETAWATFVHTDRWPGDYADVLGEAFTHILQASRAELTSTQFVGAVLENFVYNLLGLNSNGPLDRILDGPTNETLIDPWTAHLRALGARLRLGHAVTALYMRDGRIAGARMREPRGTRTIGADWYVCALPVERARRLWTAPILAADPSLAGMFELTTDWMNGVQLYLRDSPPLARGHVACLDAPWKISAVLQAQFWARDFAATYGDGRARDCLSAIVSEWDAPGVLFGKPARECTDDEIVREVWAQLKRHLNDAGPALTDDLLLSWSIDPGLVRRHGRLTNEDPLVLPRIGAYKHRPEVATRIANLVLAGDYPRGRAEVANMEAANSSGRAAANAILQRAGSREQPARVFDPYRPPEWEPLKRIDAERHRRGQPNLFDLDVAGDAVPRLLADLLPTVSQRP